MLKDGKSMEPLLYSGLDARPYYKYKWNSQYQTFSGSLASGVDRSRVLCLFKIMYHKYIYLGVETIFHLVQTLLLEYLFCPFRFC